MDSENQKTFTYLLEVETVAQKILSDKESKLDISNTQNKLREALRALDKVESRQTWIQLGSILVERPTNECKEILETGRESPLNIDSVLLFGFQEQKKAKDVLEVLENNIKKNLSLIRDLEHEPRIEGFTLKPISIKEARTLNKAFGLI